MATTSKVLARTAAATSSTTLYTVPASTTTVVTDIVVTNTAASAGTFTLTLNGLAITSGVSLPANGVTNLSIKQVLNASNIITGFASATTINFHISGVEIS